MKLYEIADKYVSVLDNLHVNEDGEIENMEDVDAVNGEFDEKTESIACYIKELKANAEALKEEKDALDGRMKAALKKAEWLSGYLAENMHVVGKRSFETSKCKLSFRKSASVYIPDETLIPKEYTVEKVTISPDKTAIKAAIKAGETVLGATLIEKETLQVK